MEELCKTIRGCQLCENLDLGPRPVFAVHPESKILVVGQAPGKAVHQSGIPWDDKSGQNLRNWLGVSDEEFYDERLFAILPMGFCYPGTGKSGDLPPSKICAPEWHQLLLDKMPNIELILLIGKYAQDYYLPEYKKETLTAKVKNYKEFLPLHFVLPHPSPRNNIWQAKNPWFKALILEELKERVAHILGKEDII